MHCPICSTTVSVNQKFCRSCGFGLEKTAQSVSEQHPTELALNLREQKNTLERLGLIALRIFGLGVIGFFLYMVGYKVLSLFAQGKILGALALLALVVVLGCGLLSVFLFAKAKDIQEASSKRRLQDPEEESESAPTARLLPENQSELIPSVTERTTELLLAEKKSRAKEIKRDSEPD
jgi:small-conductance mechanosensitive channel